MPDEMAVEATGLTKSYGGVCALAGVDLRVRAGSRCAVLGPNAAGKTTTVRILATLTRPDTGQARVAGCDIATARHQLRRRVSLTLGTPVGASPWHALAWCGGILVASLAVSGVLFRRRTA